MWKYCGAPLPVWYMACSQSPDQSCCTPAQYSIPYDQAGPCWSQRLCLVAVRLCSLRGCWVQFNFPQCKHKDSPSAPSCRSVQTPVILGPLATQLTELTAARRLATAKESYNRGTVSSSCFGDKLPPVLLEVTFMDGHILHAAPSTSRVFCILFD